MGGVKTVKATGIVRRIDDLGRVVIPKEIRRTLRIREGDPLEIFVDREGEVILKKYSPIGELGDFAQEYCDSLQQTTGFVTMISDRDAIVAVAGAPRKQWIDRKIPEMIEATIDTRRSHILPQAGEELPLTEDDDEIWKFSSLVVAPIVAEGDPIGSVIIASEELAKKVGDLEKKLADTASRFLAKQMEA